jgi:ketol-acid reductoisomerase
MDLIWERGIYGMLNGVSETARYGGLTVGPYILDETVKERMRKAAERVRSGEFAREWLNEYESGMRNLNRLLNEIKNHRIEIVGEELRRMMRSGK